MDASETGTGMRAALLTADELAAVLRVRKSWVYAATRSNAIPHVRLGRYVRFRADAIEAWLVALIWEWAAERRPALEKGHAVMHAKAIVADTHSAFVTSANLTGLGLDENIELGVLLEGGPVPLRIRSHVEALIDAGILVRQRDA